MKKLFTISILLCSLLSFGQMYQIKSSSIARIQLTDNTDTIKVDMTIVYNIAGASKLQDSSTGCTIALSLIKGDRNTMVQELNQKMYEWFEKNFNK